MPTSPAGLRPWRGAINVEGGEVGLRLDDENDLPDDPDSEAGLVVNLDILCGCLVLRSK